MSADSMNSVFGFIGILAVGCGIYCLYAYFNMKKDGHINETILPEELFRKDVQR